MAAIVRGRAWCFLLVVLVADLKGQEELKIPTTKGKRARARHLSCQAFEAVLREGEAVFDAGRFAHGDHCVRSDCSASCDQAVSAVDLDDPEPGCAACTRLVRRCGTSTAECRSLRALVADDASMERYAPKKCSSVQCKGVCDKDGVCICNAPRFGGANCDYDNGYIFQEKALDISRAESKHSKRYLHQLDSVVQGIEGKKARGSGPGSTLAATYGIRTALPHLIKMLGIRSIADAGSGDFNWFRHIINATHTMRNVKYRGLDVVGALIDILNMNFGHSPNVRFLQFDLATMRLWPNDLVILRDILFHFIPDRSLQVLKHIDASGSHFLITSYFPGATNSAFLSQTVGHRRPFYRLNLLDPPFNFSQPILNIGFDGRMHAESKSRVLGLWRLPIWS